MSTRSQAHGKQSITGSLLLFFKKANLYTHVQSSLIHNSSNMEATQVSVERRMAKQNAGYTYKRISLSLNKEENSAICYNMDTP